MKLVRFGPSGSEKPGIVAADGSIRDLSSVVDDISGAVLSPAGLDRLRAIDPTTLPAAPAGARLGSCVPMPYNFLAVGLNYADHAAESGMPIPKEPILFNKAPTSISGPDDDVVLLKDSAKSDWEVELAFVIGTEAFNVPAEKALDHIAGYCICNDVSERFWQIESTGQWVKGKSGPTYGPVGPWLVTGDEIADPQALAMTLDLNGNRMQTGSTETMIFGVVELIAYISRFMKLVPGDIITTGTPPGVGMGMKPPVFLKAGDEMVLTVEGLGQQRQKVVAA
ncbi:fumarylacetoacetate hydrolase family protein [Microbaculum marinisediminis]|uniref:Fumarylacetoacetate hydrolase family protein n=1 Tax=Microbaculum marinisediminis TaxID=2931392 RepID=A0AAW5QWP9_9HYPH|nr:fumarylacetoacetate hydrolase family protein [Microbaculum sp. A6E488]MCT8972486.1 fumarylacetoacetate hydrolase family protein [Microbaculum sp. A6E488]